MKRLIIIPVLLLLLLGCRCKQPAVQVPVKTLERKVTTLVPVAVPGDSTLLRAVFECDSLNNVILKQLDERKSKNMQSGFLFTNGKLNYKAETKPDTVYIPSDTIYLEKEIPVFKEIEKVEYRQTSWQVILGWIGKITLIMAVLWGGWKLIKRNLKTF